MSDQPIISETLIIKIGILGMAGEGMSAQEFHVDPTKSWDENSHDLAEAFGKAVEEASEAMATMFEAYLEQKYPDAR